MTIKEIEQYLKELKFDDILTECQPMFLRIDEVGKRLRNRILDTRAEVDETLQELCGIYTFLNPILAVIDAEKINVEDRYYNMKRMEHESKNEKITSTTLEKEASAFVSQHRRIRNLLESYVDVCKINIGGCQSLLKSYTDEKGTTIR